MAVVLDNNVVLDWLVFADRRVAGVAAAVSSGRLAWRATVAMRDELSEVLRRGTLGRWQPADPAAVLAAWDRHARPMPPAASLVLPALRCRDPDDQKFIDLAVATGAAALLTRDRALLRLAPAARRVGVAVCAPEAWPLPDAPSGT